MKLLESDYFPNIKTKITLYKYHDINMHTQKVVTLYRVTALEPPFPKFNIFSNLESAKEKYNELKDIYNQKNKK